MCCLENHAIYHSCGKTPSNAVFTTTLWAKEFQLDANIAGSHEPSHPYYLRCSHAVVVLFFV